MRVVLNLCGWNVLIGDIALRTGQSAILLSAISAGYSTSIFQQNCNQPQTILTNDSHMEQDPIKRTFFLMGHALMGGGQLPHFCSGKKFSVKLQCTERNLYQVLLKFCFLSFIHKDHTFWHLEAPLLPHSKCGSWPPPISARRHYNGFTLSYTQNFYRNEKFRSRLPKNHF